MKSKSYDVFVSYRTRNFAQQAATIAESLSSGGYRVWFDRRILSTKEETGVTRTKEELISLLTAAVRDSRCSLIFEAELEAVAMPPYLTREEALARGYVMVHRGALVAWNWQLLEIEASEKAMTVHARSSLVITFERPNESEPPVQTGRYSYVGSEDLWRVVKNCLTKFGISSASA